MNPFGKKAPKGGKLICGLADIKDSISSYPKKAKMNVEKAKEKKDSPLPKTNAQDPFQSIKDSAQALSTLIFGKLRHAASSISSLTTPKLEPLKPRKKKKEKISL